MGASDFAEPRGRTCSVVSAGLMNDRTNLGRRAPRLPPPIMFYPFGQGIWYMKQGASK